MESQEDAALLGKYAIEGLRVHSVTTFHGLFLHFLCIDRHAISQLPALLPCHEFPRPEGLYPCGATSQTNPFFLKLLSVMTSITATEKEPRQWVLQSVFHLCGFCVLGSNQQHVGNSLKQKFCFCTKQVHILFLKLFPKQPLMTKFKGKYETYENTRVFYIRGLRVHGP